MRNLSVWLRDLGRTGPEDLNVTSWLALLSKLIIIGAEDATDGRHRSDASRIAAHAVCPVMVVRSERWQDASPYPGHVVVGIDGTDAGQIAARFGFAYARGHRLPLVAVCFTSEPPLLQTVRDEIEHIAAQYPDVPVVRAVSGGSRAEALRRAASGARLLVVGRHGHRLPPEFRLESTNTACVAEIPSVLAVVPDGQ